MWNFGKDDEQEDEREETRDHVLWMKIDNLNTGEAIDLEAQIKRDKARIAPKARGAAFHANKKELPGRIKKSLGFGDNDE